MQDWWYHELLKLHNLIIWVSLTAIRVANVGHDLFRTSYQEKRMTLYLRTVSNKSLNKTSGNKTNIVICDNTI